MLQNDNTKDFAEQLEPVLEKEAQLFEELINLPEVNRNRVIEAVKGFNLINTALDTEERPADRSDHLRL